MTLRRALTAIAGLLLVLLVPVGPAAAAPPVTVSPTALDFGSVPLGAAVSIPVVVTNVSSNPITPNYAGGAPADPTHFNGGQNCAGITLPPGGSCAFTYTFRPKALGPLATSTAIQISDASGTSSFPISQQGRGVLNLALSAPALDFGNVAPGTTARRELLVTNVGPSSTGPIKLFGGAPSAAAFTLGDGCSDRVLAPGASCALTVAYSPVGPGRAVAVSSLELAPASSRGAGTTLAVAMTGCGPPCGPIAQLSRTLTLKLSGALVAKGQLAGADTPAECRAGVPVQIQRRRGSAWKTIDTASTDGQGRFKEKVPDRSGTYRASVAARSVDAGAASCTAVVSRSRRTG